MLQRAILLFMIMLSFKMVAQSPEWQVAGMPYHTIDVRCIYQDTSTDVLYVSGTILASPTATYANERLCKYDGTLWTSIGGTIGGQITSVVNYNGDLIVAGPFYSINGLPIFSIARYDGNNWYAMGNFDAEVTKLKTINSELYAMGYFNSVDGIAAKRIAKWDGSAWSDVNNFSVDTMDGHVTDVDIYKDNIYVCGNFVNSTLGINHLAAYKDGQWETVGGGVNGSWTDLAKMLIYRDDLYLLGLILKPGNAGNGIQKWNDTTWTEVGSGVQNFVNSEGDPGTIILDGTVYNNELYVAGCFGYAGHIPAFSVAKWDGSKWCGLATNNLLSNKALALNFYNDTLYLGIGNDTLNGVYTNRLIKYVAGNFVDTCSIEYTGVENYSIENTGFLVYPNPASGFLTIKLKKAAEQNTAVELYSIEGKLVNSYMLLKHQELMSVDISSLSQGLYLLRIKSSEFNSTVKLSKN